jgi:hypothetical protein
VHHSTALMALSRIEWAWFSASDSVSVLSQDAFSALLCVSSDPELFEGERARDMWFGSSVFVFNAFPTLGILAGGPVEDPVVDPVSDPEQGRWEALEGSAVEGAEGATPAVSYLLAFRFLFCLLTSVF